MVEDFLELEGAFVATFLPVYFEVISA
jgi:hypothetical protein